MNKINSKKSNQKGITVISLIIVVLVLLIVAKIGVTVFTGNHSILGRAGDIAIRSEVATVHDTWKNYAYKKEMQYNIDRPEYESETKVILNDDVKTIMVDGIEMGVISNYEDLNISSEFGKNRDKIQEGDTYDNILELNDVFVIDYATNTTYYVNNGRVWSVNGQTTQQEIIDSNNQAGNKTIKIARYIYNNKKMNDIIRELEGGKAITVNLETDNTTGTINGYSVKPRGWSKSTKPDAEIEVLPNEEIEVRRNATYYMSYMYTKEIKYVKPSGEIGTVEEDVYVNYKGEEKQGPINIPEEDEKIPEDLTKDGWEPEKDDDDEDVYTQDEDPSKKDENVDIKEPTKPVDPSKPLEKVLKKQITVQRYEYKNKPMEELKEYIYRKVSDSTIKPAVFNLGTTDNAMINGETAIPKIWVTDEFVLEDVKNITRIDGIKLNGTVELTENKDYYMLYQIKDKDILVETDGTSKEIKNEGPKIKTLEAGTTVDMEKGGVVLTGTAEDIDDGIVAYKFTKNESAENDPSDWTDLTTITPGEIELTGLADDTGIWYLYVKDSFGVVAKKDIEVKDNVFDDITPSVSYTNNPWKKSGTAIITFPNINGLEKTYSVDSGNNYQTYSTSEVTVTENGTVTAISRLGKITRQASAEVTDIDNQKPNILELNSASSVDAQKGGVVITAKIKDDLSGSKSYKFSKEDSYEKDQNEWIEINPITTDEVSIEKVAVASGTWYLYVQDKVGNIESRSVDISDSAFNDISPHIEYNNQRWKKTGTAIITFPEITGLQKRYTVDSGANYQEYTQSEVEVTQNGYIMAESKLGEITRTALVTVNDIDDNNPVISFLMDSSAAKLTAMLSDSQSGISRVKWHMKGHKGAGFGDSWENYAQDWQDVSMYGNGVNYNFTEMWFVGDVTVSLYDNVGNFNEKSIYVNNPDNWAPTIECTSVVSRGIGTCPACNKSSAIVDYTFSFNDQGSGLYSGYQTGVYQSIGSSDTGEEEVAHSVWTSLPGANALSGTIVERLYIHNVTTGQTGEFTTSYYDDYGNVSNTVSANVVY